MGKKIVGVIAFAAIAAVAGWNYQQNKPSSEQLSSLALANVEALARSEVSSTCFWNCTFDYNYECHVFGPGTMGPTYCFYYRAR